MNSSSSLRRIIATASTGVIVGACATPNQPTGTIEKKYYAPGPWAVTFVAGTAQGACCDSKGNPYDPRRSRKLTQGCLPETDPASAQTLYVEAGQKRRGGTATIAGQQPCTERNLEERSAVRYLLLRLAVLLLDVVELVSGVEASAGSRSDGPLMRMVMQWCCSRSSSASTSGLFWNSAYQSG